MALSNKLLTKSDYRRPGRLVCTLEFPTKSGQVVKSFSIRTPLVAGCLSKSRFTQMREPRALQSLGSLLAGAMLRCPNYPAGIENDRANWAGEPWLMPGCVGCPTLILHDQTNPVSPIAHAEWAMHSIPNAQFCNLHVGGHLIWVGKDAKKMRRERAVFISRRFDKSA
jgi:pimeloyl-ACP methyl ester carboxylesterase